MKFHETTPPRRFPVGADGSIELAECAKIELEENELVTFTTESGAAHDVTRKAWGFYAAQSLNQRVPRCGLRPILVAGGGKYFVLLVEPDKEPECGAYLAQEGMQIVARLDDEGDLENIRRAMSDA